MKVKSQRDFWSGVMFIGVGASFAWGALNYKFGSSAQPGPGYFPFGLGLLLTLLGALVLFKSLTVESHDGDPIGTFAWRPMLLILGAVALFGFTLPRLGLLLALPLLVLVSSFASSEFRLRDALLNALVLTALSWLVFVKGLGLTIPLLPITGAAA